MLASVSFSVFTDYTIRRANGMAINWSYMYYNQNSVIGVNFSEFLIKGNGISFKLAGNLS